MTLKIAKTTQWFQIYPVQVVKPMWKYISQRTKSFLKNLWMIVTPLSTRCEVCGHTMESVNDQLSCKYCEGFYPYDIAKEWMDFIINKSHIKKKETDDER
jgi:tRNA(Ile2) C34 agmatinyltransferase TiaS